MATSSTTTLILVTNTVAARQWKDELLKRTSLTEEEIGEYSGSVKEVRPVTIATYQVLTTKRGGLYPHLELVDGNDWGLIIYDEVHLLPAPIFRMTADLQARRRLGLTATLVREDGREGEVFSLIGPKRYDAPWKDIEAQGYIAPADCVEVRVDLPRDERVAYAMAEDADKYRLCATSETKTRVVEELVAEHAGRTAAGDRAVHRPAGRDRRAPGRAGDQGRHVGQGTPAALRRVPRRRGADPGGVQGRQLLHRPARGVGRDPGLRLLRFPPGGGPAPGPAAAPQEGRPRRPVLFARGHGTPWTRTSPRSGSGSSPSRATPTGSWTPRTSAPRARRVPGMRPCNTQPPFRKLPESGSIMGT